MVDDGADILTTDVRNLQLRFGAWFTPQNPYSLKPDSRSNRKTDPQAQSGQGAAIYLPLSKPVAIDFLRAAHCALRGYTAAHRSFDDYGAKL